mmetsp:Transcript_2127/g.5741  ORF Transcript_2127/g.5741 Transcript_2127/m.5741 type:complete len:136 (+) Transcript_2127:287-694(+)
MRKRELSVDVPKVNVDLTASLEVVEVIEIQVCLQGSPTSCSTASSAQTRSNMWLPQLGSPIANSMQKQACSFEDMSSDLSGSEDFGENEADGESAAAEHCVAQTLAAIVPAKTSAGIAPHWSVSEYTLELCNDWC